MMGLSIALTKGRLEKQTVSMLEDLGYGIEALKDKGRALVFKDSIEDIQYFLVKSNDCITYVNHGVADIGVVGKDTILENENDTYELLDLKIGKCKFIVASLPQNQLFSKVGHIKIGTKYPTVAKQYFLSKGMDVEIIKIDGSVELAPILGLCDGIVDIMETGTTLKENGLVVLDTVCDISARVIVNKASFKLKHSEVMKVIEDLSRKVNADEMLTRIYKEDKDVLKEYLMSRTQDLSTDVLVTVSNIIQDVKNNKDEACLKYTREFDHVLLDTMEVTEEELDIQISKCDKDFVEAMKLAKKNIEDFHKLQRQNGYLLQKEMGIYLGQRVLPLEAVGIYVPGGRAQYPSSVLMNALPAKIAGVKNVVMVTPPDSEGTIHPNIAYAAKLAGVDKIYKIGGAQAIAALAYGTQTIDRVDKIVGPGNIFVAAAKKLVYGTVDIDMIAGPSEILVVADENANPEYVAADLLSQAEHDPMASAILLTTSEDLLNSVNQQLSKQSAILPKKEIVEQSLKNYGKAIVCDSLEDCISISNEIAPEHLELMISNPMEYLQEVKNAGSVFLGYYTCESIGDYFGGTNHVLPTSGTARFSSALSVDSFIKKSSYLYYSKQAIEAYAKYIETIASEEHLQAHANAAKVREK